jgi:hypothetical protein
MSITTTVSRITPKYLRNKTKDEVISLFMLSLEDNDKQAAALKECRKALGELAERTVNPSGYDSYVGTTSESMAELARNLVRKIDEVLGER